MRLNKTIALVLMFCIFSPMSWTHAQDEKPEIDASLDQWMGIISLIDLKMTEVIPEDPARDESKALDAGDKDAPVETGEIKAPPMGVDDEKENTPDNADVDAEAEADQVSEVQTEKMHAFTWDLSKLNDEQKALLFDHQDQSRKLYWVVTRQQIIRGRDHDQILSVVRLFEHGVEDEIKSYPILNAKGVFHYLVGNFEEGKIVWAVLEYGSTDEPDTNMETLAERQASMGRNYDMAKHPHIADREYFRVLVNYPNSKAWRVIEKDLADDAQRMAGLKKLAGAIANQPQYPWMDNKVAQWTEEDLPQGDTVNLGLLDEEIPLDRPEFTKEELGEWSGNMKRDLSTFDRYIRKAINKGEMFESETRSKMRGLPKLYGPADSAEFIDKIDKSIERVDTLLIGDRISRKQRTGLTGIKNELLRMKIRFENEREATLNAAYSKLLKEDPAKARNMMLKEFLEVTKAVNEASELWSENLRQHHAIPGEKTWTRQYGDKSINVMEFPVSLERYSTARLGSLKFGGSASMPQMLSQLKIIRQSARSIYTSHSKIWRSRTTTQYEEVRIPTYLGERQKPSMSMRTAIDTYNRLVPIVFQEIGINDQSAIENAKILMPKYFLEYTNPKPEEE